VSKVILTLKLCLTIFFEKTILAPILGIKRVNKVFIMGSKWTTGSNDFGLWKVKMKVVFTQQKCLKALKGEAAMSDTLTQAEKHEMLDKAKSATFFMSRR